MKKQALVNIVFSKQRDVKLVSLNHRHAKRNDRFLWLWLNQALTKMNNAAKYRKVKIT